MSFKTALELGADWIELDIRETLDGRIVCVHDEDLQRVAGHNVRVCDMTYEELSEIDVGSGEHVPLLEDVLEFAQGKLGVNIELKVQGVEERALDMVEMRQMVRQTMFSSFMHDALVRTRNYGSREYGEEVRTALLTSEPVDDLVRRATDINANSINPFFLTVTQELVQEAHDAGLWVVPWTVNDDDIVRELVSWGVDGIITDFPDLCASVIAELEKGRS